MKAIKMNMSLAASGLVYTGGGDKQQFMIPRRVPDYFLIFTAWGFKYHNPRANEISCVNAQCILIPYDYKNSLTLTTERGQQMSLPKS